MEEKNKAIDPEVHDIESSRQPENRFEERK